MTALSVRIAAACVAFIVAVAPLSAERSSFVALEAPIVSPDTAMFAESLTVVIRAGGETPAGLYYTTDGSDPSVQGKRYTTPVVLRQTARIRAVAISIDDAHYNSPHVEGVYQRVTPRLPKPYISPAGSVFAGSLSIEITLPDSCPDAAIHYTLDGTTPASSSPEYVQPLRIGESCLVNARAVKQSYLDSDTRSARFERGGDSIAAVPAAAPAGGSYRDSIPSIRLMSATRRAMITYTLDGSAPTAASQLYTGEPIRLSEGAVLKARAFRSDMRGSAPLEETYSLARMPSPVITPGSGKSFADSLEISMVIPGFADDPHARIVIAPSLGDDTSWAYAGPFVIRTSCGLRVTARRRGYRESEPVEVSYYRAAAVAQAWYADSNHDGRIETAHLRFERPVSALPTAIVLSNPFTGVMTTFDEDAIGPVRRAFDGDVRRDDAAVVRIDPPFEGSGHIGPGTGRIPLPGEFEVTPFAIHDSVAPILRSALMFSGEGPSPDTIRLSFSEPVTRVWDRDDGSDLFSCVDRNGIAAADMSASRVIEGRYPHTLRVLVDQSPRDAIIPGRSAVLINERLHGDEGIFDMNGIAAVARNPVPIRVGSAYPLRLSAKSPFRPGVDRLPPSIQALPGVRVESATAVRVECGAPIHGSGVVYDAVGNRVFEQSQLVRDPVDNALYLIWDGASTSGRIVAGGTYLAAVTVYTQGRLEPVVKTIQIAVTR